MDKKIEEKIVNAFICNRKKERAKYELWSYKKRNDFVWKIVSCIDNSYMQKLPRISNYQEVLQQLKALGAPNLCYAISLNENIDGGIVPLADALAQTVFYGPVLISCIHGKLAYLGGEENMGAPERFLLLRQ